MPIPGRLIQAELTDKQRELRPASEFAIPDRKAWWLPDKHHALIAIAYMQAGRGNRDDYPAVKKAIRRKFGGDREVMDKLRGVSG